jgi:hypothetical protein
MLPSRRLVSPEKLELEAATLPNGCCIWEDSWYRRLTATARDRSGREAQSTSGVPSST